jgi:hypothetical protein
MATPMMVSADIADADIFHLAIPADADFRRRFLRFRYGLRRRFRRC